MLYLSLLLLDPLTGGSRIVIYHPDTPPGAPHCIATARPQSCKYTVNEQTAQVPSDSGNELSGHLSDGLFGLALDVQDCVSTVQC